MKGLNKTEEILKKFVNSEGIKNNYNDKYLHLTVQKYEDVTYLIHYSTCIAEYDVFQNKILISEQTFTRTTSKVLNSLINHCIDKIKYNKQSNINSDFDYYIIDAFNFGDSYPIDFETLINMEVSYFKSIYELSKPGLAKALKLKRSKIKFCKHLQFRDYFTKKEQELGVPGLPIPNIEEIKCRAFPMIDKYYNKSFLHLRIN